MKPEIWNDELFYKIAELVEKHKPSNMLEIGSAEGRGSTQAFVKGICHDCKLFCVEINKERFVKLSDAMCDYDYIHCVYGSSVSIDDVMPEKKVELFYYDHPEFNLRKYPLEMVKTWRENDISAMRRMGTPDNVIDHTKKTYAINHFDMVLIDGSAFTAGAELDKVYGADIVILDDIFDIKNYTNHRCLLFDDEYTLVAENKKLRNGYSIFKRRSYGKT